MSKPLILVFGPTAEGQILKAIAQDLRNADKKNEKTHDVNIRSADHFSAAELEKAAKVVIVGNYPAIAEAYKGKAEIIPPKPELIKEFTERKAAEDKAAKAIVKNPPAAVDNKGTGKKA
jgi:uncharacterized Rossmann fold enzyme